MSACPPGPSSELARTWLGDRQMRRDLKSLANSFQLLKVGLQRWLRFACTAIGVEEVRQVRSRDCHPILRGRARRRSQGFLWLPMLQLSADQVLKRLQPSVASSFPFSALAAYWRHAFAIFNKVSRCSGGPLRAIRSHSSAYVRYSSRVCIERCPWLFSESRDGNVAQTARVP